MKTLFGCLAGIAIFVVMLAVGVGIGCALAAWFCDIEPGKTYTWYSGIWQGMFCIPNWVRSLFCGDVLYKADSYTAGYNVWWWIMFIWSLLLVIGGGGKARR